VNATSDKLDLERVVAEETERRKAWLAQMVERGEWLPGFEEAAELSDYLQDAHNLLDAAAMDAAAVSDCLAAGGDLPLPVTAEHVAVMGLLAAETRNQAASLVGLAERIESRLWVLNDARKEAE
jgi:hypothetical protein